MVRAYLVPPLQYKEHSVLYCRGSTTTPKYEPMCYGLQARHKQAPYTGYAVQYMRRTLMEH